MDTNHTRINIKRFLYFYTNHLESLHVLPHAAALKTNYNIIANDLQRISSQIGVEELRALEKGLLLFKQKYIVDDKSGERPLPSAVVILDEYSIQRREIIGLKSLRVFSLVKNESLSQAKTTLVQLKSTRTQLLGLNGTGILEPESDISRSERDQSDLDTNKIIQDSLTSQLQSHVTHLRKNTVRLGDSISADKEVLDDFDRLLDGNQARVKKDRMEIKKITAGTWMTTLIACARRGNQDNSRDSSLQLDLLQCPCFSELADLHNSLVGVAVRHNHNPAVHSVDKPAVRFVDTPAAHSADKRLDFVGGILAEDTLVVGFPVADIPVAGIPAGDIAVPGLEDIAAAGTAAD